jgi:hypothetical protein
MLVFLAIQYYNIIIQIYVVFTVHFDNIQQSNQQTHFIS